MFGPSSGILPRHRRRVNQNHNPGRGKEMGNFWKLVLLTALIAFGSGCNNNDRDHLARAAGRAREKITDLTGESGHGLTTGWQAMALDARVSARLRWDKTLMSERIQVQANGGLIELKGVVKDLTQRRRAVELAESTVGAEQVVDSLEIPQQSP
jgi:BON domain